MATFRTWLRVVAAWVAALYLIGHLGAFLHTTLETHVVCAEHGHLVHADDHAEGDHVEESTAVPEWRAVASHHGDHEHCPALTVLKPLTKRVVATWAVVESPYRVASVLRDGIVQTPIRGPTVPILRLAPKTSPPIA